MYSYFTLKLFQFQNLDLEASIPTKNVHEQSYNDTACKFIGNVIQSLCKDKFLSWGFSFPTLTSPRFWKDFLCALTNNSANIIYKHYITNL